MKKVRNDSIEKQIIVKLIILDAFVFVVSHGPL